MGALTSFKSVIEHAVKKPRAPSCAQAYSQCVEDTCMGVVLGGCYAHINHSQESDT